VAKVSKKKKRRTEKIIMNSEFIKFKKWIMSLFLIMAILIPIVCAFAEGQPVWHKSDSGIDESAITAICVIADLPNTIYAGAGRSIYKSVDSGNSWYRIFMLKGASVGINSIDYDPLAYHKIYAATNNGLYISDDEGSSWDRLFNSRDGLQRQVTCIAINREDVATISIGTKRGLFKSGNGGKNWFADRVFVNKEIKSIVYTKGLYACADDGVYYKEEGDAPWQRIYIVKADGRKDINDTEDDEDTNEMESSNRVNYLATYGDKIYLATDRGVYKVAIGKNEWKALSTQGLLTERIKFILSTEKQLFAATQKGVFSYDKKNKVWTGHPEGLSTLRINMVGLSLKDRIIFAATNKGLFKARLENADSNKMNQAKSSDSVIFKDEPTILEIQRAAIEYAEVSANKIKWMRSAASNKALLPKVSLGFDGDLYRTIDLDRGSTATPDFYIEGPNDKNWGWDVDFSWDLGKIIWNDDQTNIDVRSRLMVQLRNDVIDEVTKLYFERRRLQLELQANTPENENHKLKKQLRLDELTANIDGLTDGYLSKRIKR